MRKMLLCLAALAGLEAAAQRSLDVNSEVSLANVFHSIGGEPVITARFTRLVEGSAFFSDDWLTGDLTLSGGRRIKGIPVKLDLYHRELHYRDHQEAEFMATTPIREALLRRGVDSFRFVFSSFMPAAPSLKTGWYELLVTGKMSLYKLHKKDLSENKPFDSPIAEQKIRTIPIYLLHYNDSYTELRKVKDAPAAFPSHQAELKKWLDSQKGSATADAQMKDLVQQFNALHP